MLAFWALITPSLLLSLSPSWRWHTLWILNIFYSLWHCIPSRPFRGVHWNFFLISSQPNRGTDEIPRIKHIDSQAFQSSHCRVHITHDSTKICFTFRRTLLIFSIRNSSRSRNKVVNWRAHTITSRSQVLPSFCSLKHCERAFVPGFIPSQWQGGCHTSRCHR